jgi:poly-gamma-glutamate capsule biosynthesis protein CapA/YwtB (metallophosphatase superfamily)
MALVLGCCVGDRHLPAGQPQPGDARTVGAASVAGATGDPAPAPTTTAPPPRSFSLVAGGDVLLHSPLWDQAAADAAATGRRGHDFGPLLAGIAPTVESADLAICHLETPLAPPGGPYQGYPSFSVPPEIAPALAGAGFDACTTASNHTYDRGAEGVDRTLDALDAAGLAHAGSARTPAEAGSTTLLDAAGATVALLSYTYGFNGIPPPRGEAWRSNPIDEGRILADARVARERGADVVVVALHWGTEYQHEPDALQADLAPRLIRSPDVDLLLGHHAHVVQPIEAVDGEWVVYGMGNMVAYQGSLGSTKEEGLLVRFTFTEGPGGWRTTRAEFAPLLTERDVRPVRLVEVGPLLAGPPDASGTGADPDRTDDGAHDARAPDRTDHRATDPADRSDRSDGTATTEIAVDPALRARLQEAWDRTTAIVTQRGAAAAGLRTLDSGSGRRPGA